MLSRFCKLCFHVPFILFTFIAISYNFIFQSPAPFDYLFDDGISNDEFMDFSDDELMNIFDMDKLDDTFEPIEVLAPAYKPKEHKFKAHDNLSNLLEEMLKVAENDLEAPQAMVILQQKGPEAFDQGPPASFVLGIYAFDRPASDVLLAIYMAMFQDCYHFAVRKCDLNILHSYIKTYNPNVQYCYNQNNNPYYHFENSPDFKFDTIVDDGINLFQELYNSTAMKSAGMRGPTPIVSIGLTTTPASQMREGRSTMLLPNTKPITNNNSGLIGHLGIPIFKIMLKSLIIYKKNYKPVKDGVDLSSPFEIPLVYSKAYRDARLQLRKEFISSMVGDNEPDNELKKLISLTCLTFFGNEVDVESIQTMNDAIDLVVSVCPEAGACRLIPATYPHYDVKGDPFAVCNTLSLLLKCGVDQISNQKLKKVFLRNCHPLDKSHLILYAFYGRKAAHDYASDIAHAALHSIMFQDESDFTRGHQTDNVSKLIANCLRRKVGSILDFQALFESNSTLSEQVKQPSFKHDIVGNKKAAHFSCYKITPSFDRMVSNLSLRILYIYFISNNKY